MSDVPPPSPSPEPEPQPQNPLEYESPVIDPNRPAGGVPYVLQMLIGFASFFVAGGVAIGAGIVINASEPAPFFASAAIMLLAVAGFGIVARARWRWRGVIVGLAIALGLVLLGCGACAAIMSSMRF
jgi:hypothetical protein